MERASFGDVTLEYEVKGSGDPVLLIGGAHVAGSYMPLLAQPELIDRYRLNSVPQAGHGRQHAHHRHCQHCRSCE